MALNKKVTFVHKNYQVAYSIILIIFIPAAIIANTFIFTRGFNKRTDSILHDKAISIGQVINASILDDLNDTAAMQKQIESIAAFDEEISGLQILFRSWDDFIVIANL